MKWDTKLVIWVSTIVFIAGGGWWSLKSVSTDVAKIQTTLDDQADALTIHVSSGSHPGGEERVTRIETKQDVMSKDIKSLMITQSAICQATGARCR